jgi:hypothetical protein
MIKSVEAVIAITVLFMFILVLFSSYTYNDYKENMLTEKVYEILNIRAQEQEFREIINDGNVSVVHNYLYNYINTNYAIKLCDYLEVKEECVVSGNNVPEETSAYSVNYYFYDSNKTLNVIIWN